jgi:hypothetical protein
MPLMRPMMLPNGKRMMTGLTPCADCGCITGVIGEWYMLKRHVWEQAWPGTSTDARTPMKEKHYLCIGCCERRLGRRLKPSDFSRRKDGKNDPAGDLYMSRRLRSRLISERTNGHRGDRAKAHKRPGRSTFSDARRTTWPHEQRRADDQHLRLCRLRARAPPSPRFVLTASPPPCPR